MIGLISPHLFTRVARITRTFSFAPIVFEDDSASLTAFGIFHGNFRAGVPLSHAGRWRTAG